MSRYENWFPDEITVKPLVREIKVEELITFVRGLDAEFRNFHLTPCICGAPSWKQPCPFCGFYPYGNDPVERKRCEGKTAQLDTFMRKLNGRGAIRFYFEVEVARLESLLKDRYLKQRDIEEITQCADKYRAGMLALANVVEPDTIGVWEAFRDPSREKALHGWE